MSKQFYFGTPEDTDSDLFDNDDTLPFPKPLERSAFLASDFSPAAYLSSLSDRFQTLEDLQNELRELAQSLNKELVDLVNNNYQDFLSLGNTLSGGEERIEEIRVGLLGFQRDVNGVRETIIRRKDEISELLSQKSEIRNEISRGVSLINFAENLDDLEHRLGIVQPRQVGNDERGIPKANQFSIEDEWDEDLGEENGEFDEATGIPKRLGYAVQKYRLLQLLRKRHDLAHPFLMSQSDRLRKIYDTLQLDLETAIRQESEVKVKQRIIQFKASLDD